MPKAQLKSFADVGKDELDKIADLARRALAVDDDTNPKLKQEFEVSMAERTMAMKFRNESPRLVLMLIEKLRGANAIIAALTDNR